MKHLVVLSDLHLWQATDHDDLWMRYRHRRFVPDAQFVELCALLCAQIPDGELELVLNGDIFDFDLPPVEGGYAVAAPAPRDTASATGRMARILDDHEPFLTALGGLLLRQHRVVFIAGNHDLQMNFPDVQELVRRRILLSCQRLQPDFPAWLLDDQLLFRPWFYRTAHGVHVEHGNQYDPYCSVLDPAWPFEIDGRLATNLGSLSLQHLGGKLGYFNPNVESTFLLTTKEYVDHWLRYYLRSPRSLLGTWILGAVRIAWALAGAHGLRGPSLRAAELQGAEEAAHYTLFAIPDLRGAFRILGVNRLLVGAALLLTALLCLLWAPLAVAAALATVALYRALARGGAPGLDAVPDEVGRAARLISRIYGASAVVFGHTHQPAGVWDGDVFYGNSGTWVPMYRDIACSIPIEESRPFIWLRADGGRLEGGLYRLHAGTLHPASPPRAPSREPKRRRERDRTLDSGENPAADTGRRRSRRPRQLPLA